MGDATSQPTNGLQLLGLAELFLAVQQRLIGLQKLRRPLLHSRLKACLELPQLPVRLLNFLGSLEDLRLYMGGLSP